MAVDVIGTAKGFIPSFNIGGTISLIAWFVIFAIVCIIFGIIAFYILRRKKYNIKIVVFEKVGQSTENTITDFARKMKYGEGGDYILITRKFKKYLPPPKLQTGRRTYWYYIRQDGEWINFEMPDIDEKMKKANVQFLDADMRFARTQLQRGLKEAFQKESFFQKHGVMIVSISFIVVIAVMTFLLFDKWIDVVSSIGGVADRVGELIDKAGALCNNPGYAPA